MCGNISDDVTLMYAGSSYLTTVPNYEEILAKFEDVMPYDFDGDDQLAEINTGVTEIIEENLELKTRIKALRENLEKTNQQ